MIETKFKYTDPYGQESELSKTYTECVLETMTEIGLLLEDFKAFLTASGFGDNVSKIQYVEDKE